VVGTSRKSFLGLLSTGPDGHPAPADDRLEGTVATTTWAIIQGAAMVRVHDVRPAVQAAFLAGRDVPAEPTPTEPTPAGVAR
jgi:dihydropteroate synthase